MKSIKRAHIAIIANCDHGLVLAARLRRMDVAQVTALGRLDQAKAMCEAGGVDACIVVIDDVAAEAASPVTVADAPGRRCGVPSLMIVPIATPYLRKLARRRGYLATVSATITPRMLYRRVGAELQWRRAAPRGRRMPGGIGMPDFRPIPVVVPAKPTLH
jgi:hypothetical protein